MDAFSFFFFQVREGSVLASVRKESLDTEDVVGRRKPSRTVWSTASVPLLPVRRARWKRYVPLDEVVPDSTTSLTLSKETVRFFQERKK